MDAGTAINARVAPLPPKRETNLFIFMRKLVALYPAVGTEGDEEIIIMCGVWASESYRNPTTDVSVAV